MDLMVGRCSSAIQRRTTDGSVPTRRANWVGVVKPASWIASRRYRPKPIGDCWPTNQFYWIEHPHHVAMIGWGRWPRSEGSAQRGEVGRGDPLGHDHAPRVED